MLGKLYAEQNCSAARALELVGERWSLLILRDSVFRGITQFGCFQKSLGIATNILAARLDSFVENGLLEFAADREAQNTRHYLPTQKALALKHVIMALTAWGDAWVPDRRGPIEFGHHGCEGHVLLLARCDTCDKSPGSSEIMTRSRKGQG